MNEFEEAIAGFRKEGLFARKIDILQVNVGFLCNEVCSFCHLKCGPNRTEVMSWRIMQRVTSAAAMIRPRIVDITGGAPELNPYIRGLVMALRDNKQRVQIKTNLTALMEPGSDDLPDFLRDCKVKLVASLQCHTEDNVASQRGYSVYEKSIRTLKRLNEAGYTINPDLHIDFVYNPGGTALPGSQSTVETAYRRELYEHFNINFSRFRTITNVPIGRYRTMLRREGMDAEHARLLREAFNPNTLDHLMCRHQISIGWDGQMYDCDFNLALGIPIDRGVPSLLTDADFDNLAERRIKTGNHCFGCTAGIESSYAGILSGRTA